MLTRQRSPVMVALCVLAACTTDEERDLPRSTVRDSAGIAIATSRHALAEDLEGWSISADPVLEVSTRPDLVVHWIRGALRLSDGRIAMVSESTKQIIFLSADGDLMSTVGGEGDGPGEFRGPFHFTRHSGDTLIVVDRRSRRVSWFDRYGKFLRQELPSRERLQSVVPQDQSVGVTRFVAPGYYVAATAPRGLAPPGARIRRPRGFVLSGPDGGLRYLGGFLGMEYFDEADNRTGRWAFFANNSHLVTGGSPPRLYIGETSPFEVRVYDLTGDLVRIMRDEVPPPSITDQDIEWERWELLDWGEQSGRLEQFLRRADAMPIPDRKPAFEALHVDSEGHLWAKGYTSYRPDPVRYRIYDSKGLRVGSVRLPGRLQVFDIGLDYVLGIESDLDYIETLQMYALTRPAW